MAEYPRDLLITEDVIREFEEKVGVRFINKTECAKALAEHDAKVIADYIENGKGLALCDNCDYYVSVEEAYKNGKEDGRTKAIEELERLFNLEPFSVYVLDVIRHDIKKLKEKKMWVDNTEDDSYHFTAMTEAKKEYDRGYKEAQNHIWDKVTDGLTYFNSEVMLLLLQLAKLCDKELKIEDKLNNTTEIFNKKENKP